MRLGKRSVAYHLMPIYGRPALLNGLSPALRRRMQGKACFNFSSVDEALLDELDELTARALEWYRAEGYLEAGARVRPNGTVDRPHS